MRVRFKFVWLISLLFCFSIKASAADTILVMPFENRSQMGDYNWIRESFAILMADVLDVPGIVILSTDERNVAFDRLRLSPNDLLTRAVMIRVSDTAQANLVLVGEFDIGGEKDNITIAITARLIDTQEGRLVGNKVFNFSGPLSDLQQMQGQLAWNILYLRNPSLPYSKDQLVRKSTGVPPRAYESLVKALQTQDLKLREGFLRRALQEYEREGKGNHYSQAIFELGLINYRQGNFAEAVKLFKELTKDDSGFAESLFFLGLAAHRTGDYNEAIAVFSKLAETMPMPEVFNNAGSSMFAKGDFTNCLQMLRRAVANSPNDPNFRFNYGYALWRNQNYPEAAQHLRVAVESNPRDGEALFFLAKSLAAINRQAEAAQADNEAKRHLESYAKWAVAPDKIPLLVRLKMEFNRATFYKLERQQEARPSGPTAQQISQRQSLDRARQMLNENNDTEAMNELQRVLTVEANNAEAHYLRGFILYRRGETESAISALQYSVSLNTRLIEAHISLGRIYLSRGDRALALAHSKQALEIDPQNRDAIALKQQVETGQ